MSEHTALTAVRWVRSEPHDDLGLWHRRLLARRVRFEQRWAARFFRPDSTAPKKRGPEGLQAEPDKGDGHQVCISVVSAGPKPRPFSEWRKTTISKKPKIDHEYHAGKDKMKITIKGYRAVSLADFVLRLKVDTAQDDAGRSAFELPCQVFASDTLFNPVAQPHELCLALVRHGSRHAFQIIHGGSRDGARYLPFAVNHRKQYDHPIKFIAAKVTACERHLTSPLVIIRLSTRRAPRSFGKSGKVLE